MDIAISPTCRVGGGMLIGAGLMMATLRRSS